MRKFLILTVALSFIFTACEKDENSIDDPVIGTWKEILRPNSLCKGHTFTFETNGNVKVIGYYTPQCVREEHNWAWKNVGDDKYRVERDGQSATVKVTFRDNKHIMIWGDIKLRKVD